MSTKPVAENSRSQGQSERRTRPRYALVTSIRAHAKCPDRVIRSQGMTVEISEGGVSAYLRGEFEAGQQVEPTGQTFAGVFARDRLVAQTAVRDLHVCAGAGARELPAYENAVFRVSLPVEDPDIRQNARRIEFNNLSMSFEFAHDVDLV